MSDKLEILKMIEIGKISVEEGLQLIEALEQTEKIEDEVREERYPDEATEEDLFKKPQNEQVLKDFDVSLTTCKLNIERSTVEEITVELLDAKTRTLIEKPEWLHLHEDKNTVIIKESRTTNLTDIFDFFKSGNTMLNSIFINVKVPMETVIDKGKFTNVSGSMSLFGLNGIDIDARTVSGKVHAADLKVKVLGLKSTSGSVIADNITVAKVYLKSTSGKVKTSGVHSVIDCKTVSGNIEVESGDTLRAINASTVSGKTSLYVTQPESFNLNFNTISGGIDTNGFAVVNKSNSGKRNVQISNRSSDHSIQATSVSGKIILDKWT